MFGKNKKQKISQAQFMAPQWLKIAQDCVDLVNTTTNPDVFFKRYDLCIQTVQKLVNIEKHVSFSGKKPHVFLNELHQKRNAATHDFIMRYYYKALGDAEKLKTVKGKINKINKFCENIEIAYYDYLSKDNLKLLYDLRDSAIEMYNSEK